MNKRLIIAAIIVLAASGTGGYLLFANDKSAAPGPNASQTPAEPPSPPPTPTPDASLANKEANIKDLGDNITKYRGLTVIVTGKIVDLGQGKYGVQDDQRYILGLDLSDFKADINSFRSGTVKVRGQVIARDELNSPLQLKVEFINR